MKQWQPLSFALGLGIAALACGPKTDTAPPDDGGGAVCPDDAKVCEDGSSVSREGPSCEFPACPDESDADPDADAAADGDADAEPADAEPEAEE